MYKGPLMWSLLWFTFRSRGFSNSFMNTIIMKLFVGLNCWDWCNFSSYTIPFIHRNTFIITFQTLFISALTIDCPRLKTFVLSTDILLIMLKFIRSKKQTTTMGKNAKRNLFSCDECVNTWKISWLRIFFFCSFKS